MPTLMSRQLLHAIDIALLYFSPAARILAITLFAYASPAFHVISDACRCFYAAIYADIIFAFSPQRAGVSLSFLLFAAA